MGTINRTTAQLNKQLYKADLHLNLSASEVLTGDGTNWYSPGTNVQVIGTPENFSYTGGSIVYNGTEDIEVLLQSTVSMSGGSAGISVEMTGGKNGTPNTDFIIDHVLTTANDEKELTMNFPVVLTAGDTLDFYVRASANVTLQKAVWLVHNNE